MATRGRPRAFDRDAALRHALRAFWEHGYEGTSMATLVEAMSINSSSLYSAFGGKEQLFREAVALYGRTEGAHTGQALCREPTAREAVAAMLHDNIDAYCDPSHPAGCLVVLGAINYPPGHSDVRDHLTGLRREVIDQVRQRLTQGIADGDVPAGTDTQAIALFYTTVLDGLSIQARDGHSSVALHAVADAAVAAWDPLLGRPRPQH